MSYPSPMHAARALAAVLLTLGVVGPPAVAADREAFARTITMVVSGWHFGERSAVVALGDRVLRVKSHSDSALVVELPTDVSPGSYRLMITVMEPSKLSSEPFSAAVFAAR